MSTEVAKSEKKPTQLANVKGWIESPEFKDQIARALPKHMTADRFLRIAITATMRTPKLLECTQASLLRCLLDLSVSGLEADGRRAHLIPFEDRKRNVTECTLIIDFKGYAELVMRSGLVSNIHADVVCENDDFEADKGQILRHKIDYKKPRGEAYAAYTVIRFKDGTEKTEIMPKEDILSIRDRSSGWRAFKAGYTKTCPWDPKEPVIEREMWKKTTFRRATKWVPLSPEIREVIEKDDASDSQFDATHQATVLQTSASKSQALVDVLKSRQQEHHETHEPEGDSDTESETTIDPKLMTQFNKLNQWIAIQPGVESIALDDGAPISEWKLPNGGFLLIGTKDSLPESPDEATVVVDVGDAKSFDKLKQIIKASQPQE